VVALVVVVVVVATSDNKKSSTSSPTGSTTPTTATSTAPSLSTTTAPKTTAPSNTIPGGLTLSESCTSPDYGFSLDYPNGWFAEESFPGWQCALFNPSPFVLQPDTEVPPVAVLAAVYEYAFDPSVAMYTDPTYNELLSSNDETIDGHKAVAVEVVALQDGLEPAGTSRYAVLVEYGTDRTFVIETSSVRGDDYTIDKQVVRAMANSLTIPG